MALYNGKLYNDLYMKRLNNVIQHKSIKSISQAT